MQHGMPRCRPGWCNTWLPGVGAALRLLSAPPRVADEGRPPPSWLGPAEPGGLAQADVAGARA